MLHNLLDGRDTDPYSFYDDGRQAWNLIANRMPILREGMPQRHTVLGDPKHYTRRRRWFIIKSI